MVSEDVSRESDSRKSAGAFHTVLFGLQIEKWRKSCFCSMFWTRFCQFRPDGSLISSCRERVCADSSRR